MKFTKQAIILLILSLIMLASATFAWMNMSKVGKIDGIDSNIADFSNLITFYVKRKGAEDYTSILTIEEMDDVFGDTRPGETYEFKVVFNNTTGAMRSFVVELKDILSEYHGEDSQDFDLRDVFYIDQGHVNVNYYDIETGQLTNSLPTHTIQVESAETVYKHEQELNLYRLSNLTKSTNNNLVVSNLVDVNNNQRVEVVFTLVYDPTTENILYQYNKLTFSGIYIYGQ